MLSDGVTADLVDGSYSHGVRMKDIWNAASRTPRMVVLVRDFVE